MTQKEKDKLQNDVEEAYGKLLAKIYRMREVGMYQEAYDNLNNIISLSVEDKQILKEMHGDKIQ